MKTITEQEKKVFDYLELVKESAQVNMAASTPHIVKEFSISKVEARKILAKWMTLSEDGYDHLEVTENQTNTED